MFSNTRSLMRRYEVEQHRLLLATLPTCGVVEYVNLLSRVPLTGKVWRAGEKIQLAPKGAAK